VGLEDLVRGATAHGVTVVAPALVGDQPGIGFAFEPRMVAFRSLDWFKIGVVAVREASVAISKQTVSIADLMTSAVTRSISAVLGMLPLRVVRQRRRSRGVAVAPVADPGPEGYSERHGGLGADLDPSFAYRTRCRGLSDQGNNRAARGVEMSRIRTATTVVKELR
jgi:hypothetical protein